MHQSEKRLSPYTALLPVLAGVFIAADDQTVVVTVLPQVMLDMNVEFGELGRASWTITGYLLGYVAAMPVIGRVSDVWGHRRVFLWAMGIFMAGSVLVALAPTLGWLIAARVFQALGGGAMVPVSIAIAGDLFPAHRRGTPLGLVGASAEAGGVIGPLWGGLIVNVLSWPWVFWLNLPLGAMVMALTFRVLGPSPRKPAKIDLLGGGLITLSVAALTLGLSKVGESNALTAVYLSVALATFGLFILRQRLSPDPLLPKVIFRTWAFRSANSTHLLVGGALIIGMVTVPLMANTVLGRTPLDGGLQLMRMTVAIPVGAVIGGLACQILDYRIPTAAGLALAATGFWLMSGWGLDIADPALTIHLALTGLGFGLVIAPIALAATNSVGQDDRGSAAALVTATRMVGMTIGLAALTAWGTGRLEYLVGGLQLPLPVPGETIAQTQARADAFQTHLIGSGLQLFNEFFLVAMAVCLVALLTAAVMAWGPMKRPPGES